MDEKEKFGYYDFARNLYWSAMAHRLGVSFITAKARYRNVNLHDYWYELAKTISINLADMISARLLPK